jgi:hypothetical protein
MDRAPWSVIHRVFGARGTVHGALLFLLLVPFLQAADPREDKVWIIIRPLQCMRNPWEKEWLANNKNDVSKYPRRKEFALIKKYFERRRVPILEFRFKPFMKGQGRCETCECPRGDTLYLLISALDAPTMVSLGYTERLPAATQPK